MVELTKLTARTASREDQQELAHLIHFDAFVHRHLDYRPPLDWIGHDPFLILDNYGKIEAALACPPDPHRVAWIRLFAASTHTNIQKSWEILWETACDQLREYSDLEWVSAIPLQNWFRRLLVKSEFNLSHFIVMMKWERQRIENNQWPSWLTIRPMTHDDLAQIQIVDREAFVPVWQNSRSGLEYAFKQAAVATVAEVEREIVGYQISTQTHMGAHLARLAVRPEKQGLGIGRALLNDLLSQFERRGAPMVTVNTQKDNQNSLSLYLKSGFKHSGEEYPIYQYDV